MNDAVFKEILGRVWFFKPPSSLSYTLYIASVTHRALKAVIGGSSNEPNIVREVAAPRQRDGTYVFNTTKVMEVVDFAGTRYRITIEDMRDVEREAKCQTEALMSGEQLAADTGYDPHRDM